MIILSYQRKSWFYGTQGTQVPPPDLETNLQFLSTVHCPRKMSWRRCTVQIFVHCPLSITVQFFVHCPLSTVQFFVHWPLSNLLSTVHCPAILSWSGGGVLVYPDGTPKRSKIETILKNYLTVQKMIFD